MICSGLGIVRCSPMGRDLYVPNPRAERNEPSLSRSDDCLVNSGHNTQPPTIGNDHITITISTSPARQEKDDTSHIFWSARPLCRNLLFGKDAITNEACSHVRRIDWVYISRR